MKQVTIFLLLFLIAPLYSLSLYANTVRLYDKNGYVGRSVTKGSTTHHYNRNGSYSGRSVIKGQSTRHYNSRGYIGRSSVKGSSIHHYNRNGVRTGRSTLPNPVQNK